MNLRQNQFSNNVVTKGNYSMVAAGTNLWAGTRKGGTGLLFNVSPGQPVAFYLDKDAGTGVPTTVDSSNLTADMLKKGIHIGVGVDLDDDGLVDDIRLIGQDGINGCLISQFRTIAPSYGLPEIKDLYFKDVKCDKTYSTLVKVDDNLTRSFAPWHKTSLEFVGSTVYDCNTACDNCSEGTADAGEVACQLVDALNNDFELKLYDDLYPDFKQRRTFSRPFRAVKLHNNSFVFCFTPADATCEDCTHIDGVAKATVNSVEYTLQGTLNPADNTQTLIGQVQQVADQINDLFEEHIGPHSGHAYVTGGFGKCASIELHVNTCDANFVLTDHANAPIAPCTTNDPLATVYTLEDDCVDCGDQASTETYSAGIRIFAEQLMPECDVFLDKPQPLYSRFIEVDAIGDGWSCSKHRRVTAQAATPPANIGPQVQWEEYQSQPIGRGRDYRRGTNNQGWLGLPGQKSRVRLAPLHSNCGTSYCRYDVDGAVNIRRANNEKYPMEFFSSIFVPQGDSVTKGSVEQFLAKIESVYPGVCGDINAVSCDGGDVVLS